MPFARNATSGTAQNGSAERVEAVHTMQVRIVAMQVRTVGGGDALKPGRRATHNTRRERRQVRIQDGNSCIRDAGEKSKVATSLGVHPTPPR